MCVIVRHWSEDAGRIGEAEGCGPPVRSAWCEPAEGCDVFRVDRSSVRYLSGWGDDAELNDAIKRVSRERRRFGCCRIQVMIVRETF